MSVAISIIPGSKPLPFKTTQDEMMNGQTLISVANYLGAPLDCCYYLEKGQATKVPDEDEEIKDAIEIIVVQPRRNEPPKQRLSIELQEVKILEPARKVERVFPFCNIDNEAFRCPLFAKKVLYNWLQVRRPVDVVKYLNKLIVEQGID